MIISTDNQCKMLIFQPWHVSAQWRPLFWDLMDCSPSGSFVLGIFQARKLEWVAISSSRGSSWPRYRICISCNAGSLRNGRQTHYLLSHQGSPGWSWHHPRIPFMALPRYLQAAQECLHMDTNLRGVIAARGSLKLHLLCMDSLELKSHSYN